MGMAMGIVVSAALVVLYMLPSFVAARRKCAAAPAIVILNLFLGWTFLGWVGALVWAAAAKPRLAA